MWLTIRPYVHAEFPCEKKLYYIAILKLFYLFICLLVSPYYNTQNYNKNKNNIHNYRQGDRNSVSQLLQARIRTYKHKKLSK